jgi:signal transduction histidine kinase
MANIQARARELGGTLTLTRARLGGLQVQVSVPLPSEENAEARS